MTTSISTFAHAVVISLIRFPHGKVQIYCQSPARGRVVIITFTSWFIAIVLRYTCISQQDAWHFKRPTKQLQFHSACQVHKKLFALDGDNETGNQAHVFQETMKGKLSVCNHCLFCICLYCSYIYIQQQYEEP